MFRQYLFLPLIFALLAGLKWLSYAESMNPRSVTMAQVGASDPSRLGVRQDLMEDLDRIVSYEHYYHSLHGRFTLLLNRIGFPLSSSVIAEYDIRVSVATADFLLINAIAEKDGKMLELVSIDQDFRVHSSFPLPEPRRQFLVAQAMKRLRVLRSTPQGEVAAEPGIYQGYFQYSLKTASDQDQHAYAIGLKPPVQGEKIELHTANDEEMALALESILAGDASGDSEGASLDRFREQEYLAQRIFLGETGRFPRDREELGRVTRFQLAPERDPAFTRLTMEPIGTESQGFPDSSREEGALSLVAPTGRREKSQQGGLEIEPVGRDQPE